MDNRDFWTVEAMKKYGGSFVKTLADLASRADEVSLERIKIAFPEYWSAYEEEGKSLEQLEGNDDDPLREVERGNCRGLIPPIKHDEN